MRKKNANEKFCCAKMQNIIKSKKISNAVPIIVLKRIKEINFVMQNLQHY